MKSKVFVFLIPVICLAGRYLASPWSNFSDDVMEKIAKTSQKFPHYWTKAPISLTEYPTDNSGIYINPWNYLHRLGMYKCIIEATGKLLNGTELAGKMNLLWGLPLQHGWQFETERLRDFTNRTTCGFHNGTQYKEGSEMLCISPSSWWASMNYYLAVIPFLAAVNMGYFNQETNGKNVEMLSPDFNAEKFCYGIQNCNEKEIELMKKWHKFFSYIQTCSQTKCETDLASEKLWEAHIASIEAGMRLFSDVLEKLSSAEQRFGTGWVKTVTLLAAVRFRTNMIQTSKFQELGLPTRILWDTDTAPYIQDLTSAQNTCLYILDMLLYWDNLLGGYIVSTWSAIMCNNAARQIGRTILSDLLQSPLSTVKNILSLLWNTITEGC